VEEGRRENRSQLFNIVHKPAPEVKEVSYFGMPFSREPLASAIVALARGWRLNIAWLSQRYQRPCQPRCRSLRKLSHRARLRVSGKG
jgi:hypothetical protein